MKGFALPYGKGNISFEVPKEQLLNTVLGSEQPVIENIEKA
jgi:hypothetical protein